MFELIFTNITGLLIIKVLFLLLLALLFVFLLVVLKQSFAMRQVIDDAGASETVIAVATLNVFVGFSLFVAALIIL